MRVHMDGVAYELTFPTTDCGLACKFVTLGPADDRLPEVGMRRYGAGRLLYIPYPDGALPPELVPLARTGRLKDNGNCLVVTTDAIERDRGMMTRFNLPGW